MHSGIISAFSVCTSYSGHYHPHVLLNTMLIACATQKMRFFFKEFKEYLLYVCKCFICMCICVPCVSCGWLVPEWALDPLGLKLQRFVSLCLDTSKPTWDTPSPPQPRELEFSILFSVMVSFNYPFDILQNFLGRES